MDNIFTVKENFSGEILRNTEIFVNGEKMLTDSGGKIVVPFVYNQNLTFTAPGFLPFNMRSIRYPSVGDVNLVKEAQKAIVANQPQYMPIPADVSAVLPTVIPKKDGGFVTAQEVILNNPQLQGTKVMLYNPDPVIQSSNNTFIWIVAAVLVVFILRIFR